MRRASTVLTGLLVAGMVVALSGCSSSSSDATPAPTTTVTGALAPVDWTGDSVPTVSGGYGDKPTITFTSAPAPGELMRKVLIQGKGAAVKKGSLVAVDYLGQIYGGKVFDNSYDRHSAAGFQIGVQKVIPGWDNTIVGMSAKPRRMRKRRARKPTFTGTPYGRSKGLFPLETYRRSVGATTSCGRRCP